jgi:hypothetical protein
MRHLSLVPARPSRPAPSPARQEAAGALGAPVAYVPVKLLLAASGRCSCDECCREAVRPRQAGPMGQRQPVRNIHLLR